MTIALFIYDEPKLVRSLSQMPVAAVTAFAACCASRIVTAAEARGADLALAVRAIDRLRHLVEGLPVFDGDIMEAQLIGSIEDEDEAPDFDASLKEDALAAAAFGIRYATSGDPMNAAWAARRAYDAVDRYAAIGQNEIAFTEAFEAGVLAHHLVQTELGRQQRDIRDLQGMSRGEESFAVLIDRSRRESLLG